MMKKNNVVFILSLLFLTSCLSVKEVRYLQPNENLVLNSEGLISYNNIPKYRVTKRDLLKLNIITTPKGDAAQFYSTMYSRQGAQGGQEGGDVSNSLKLDDNGNITVFGIGKIKAEGRTTDEIAAEIQERVNENFLEGKSEVRVYLSEIKYTLLTDVDGKSLRKTITEPTMNILELIADNGGLDRNIDRKNIVVYRTFPEGVKKAQIDLTREDIQNSEYFWVQNGDLIMLSTKAKAFYGFGKEPLQTITAGVSMLTTALSIYLLISKF